MKGLPVYPSGTFLFEAQRNEWPEHCCTRFHPRQIRRASLAVSATGFLRSLCLEKEMTGEPHESSRMRRQFDCQSHWYTAKPTLWSSRY